MRGHIRKRGNMWVVVVETGKDEDGRRRQKWHSGFRTRREASGALTEILSRLQTGGYVEPSRQDLRAFLTEWLEAVKARLKPSTYHSYSMNIERHIIPALGSTSLQNLSAPGLNAFYGRLLETGRLRGGTGGLSPRTVRYIHMILRQALAAAVKWNKVSRNAADSADPPKPRNADEMRTWSAEELRDFLLHVKDDRLYAAWVVAAQTGLRRGELLGLHWREVDVENGRVAITQTLLVVQDKMTWDTPKTAKARRSVALDATTLNVLKDHRRRQLEERLAWGPAYEDNDLAFARENGAPIHPHRFSHWFGAHVKAAGLPRIRFHDLRHTHATLALAAGIHPKVVSERLGHASVSFTLDRYSHNIPALEEEAAEKVARLVFG